MNDERMLGWIVIGSGSNSTVKDTGLSANLCNFVYLYMCLAKREKNILSVVRQKTSGVSKTTPNKCQNM